VTRPRPTPLVTGHCSLGTGHCSLVTAVLVTACNLTPLTNKIAVGEEAFVVGVGEGSDSATDLFAAPAGGGNFVRLTFNRAEERAPRFAPSGARVAYLRRSPGSPRWALVVLDLVNAAEQSVAVPTEAGKPERLGWSSDGARVVLKANGYYASATPPEPMALRPVDSAALTGADSATRELLGSSREGLIEPCGVLLCVVVGDAVTSLGPGVSGAIRWGADSVGYFSSGGFQVRPLTGGLSRRPAWNGLPSRLRELSYHEAVRSPP
jgi:hypothetical protein